MNRAALTAEIAGAAALQLTLAALLSHATERATEMETEQADSAHRQIPNPRRRAHRIDDSR